MAKAQHDAAYFRDVRTYLTSVHTELLPYWPVRLTCLTNSNTNIQKFVWRELHRLFSVCNMQVFKMGYTLVAKMYTQLTEARNAPDETSPTSISVRLSFARQTMLLIAAS